MGISIARDRVSGPGIFFLPLRAGHLAGPSIEFPKNPVDTGDDVGVGPCGYVVGVLCPYSFIRLSFFSFAILTK